MVVVINKIERCKQQQQQAASADRSPTTEAVDQTSSGILKHQGVFQMLSSQQQPLAKHEFFFMPEKPQSVR